MSKRWRGLAVLVLAASSAVRAAAGQSDIRIQYDSIRAMAEQGDADAQRKLGFMYLSGRGVPENDVEAVRWFRAAAEQGDASAQYNLGVMYARGEGVPENYVQAYAWANLAAAQGDDLSSVRARKLKDDLTSRMSSSQIARAQELSIELLDRINNSR